jgi:CheY-like chemotaxis protein
VVLNGLPEGDRSRELLREVIGAGARAAALTRQLLAFSRRAIIEPRTLDLRVVVTDVEKMLRRIIGEDIQLSIGTDPDVGTVRADPGQIEQVVMNLVVNARDAMPRGGRLTIEVRGAELDEDYVRAHPGARAGSHVLLAVTDTGCGMDEATKARVFEPFFTTKGERGTGLGLATVHGIVTQSMGHVAVYSELGRGTAFKVYLPCADVPVPAPSARPAVDPLLHGGETILLVEDEDAVRALTRRILLGYGYTVLEARDGAEAIRIADEHQGPIHLLMADVVMPRLSGREVAEHLRRTYPGIKVLFLSGYTEDAVVRHGILEAEVAFLQKPFTTAVLTQKVRDCLDCRV